MITEFKSLLEKHDKVSILIHNSADVDTFGTALGIYGILKNEGKQVEVCNVAGDLPNYLDFLPHFAKIKNQMDFDNSLIISSDSASIDLLGFDLRNQTIVNIDNHVTNTNYGALNIVNPKAVSSSVVAYELLKGTFKITKEVATCFYVALLTRTQHFRTLNVDKDVFTVASELIALGINLEEINKNLTQRKSLSSFRVLSATLDTLELCEDAQIATMVLSRDLLEKTGAKLNDTREIINYAMALVTVKVAVLLIEFEGYVSVSLRSNDADVSALAVYFGGGGHLLEAGFRSESLNMDLLLEEIKKEIKIRGLINGS